MKHPVTSALIILTSILCLAAQNPESAEQRAENMRSQLRDVIGQESELQTRLQQLEEDLKPENIQRSLALIGTTRPAELREQRRLQLEKDKAAVQAQLDQLASSRTRLEASIASAEAESDRQRIQANTPPPPPATTVTTNTRPAVKPSSTPNVRQQKRKPAPRVRRPKPRRRVRSV